MLETAPFILRVSSTCGCVARPFRTAAEAYDGAAAVRRTVGDPGAVLQVEDVTSGAVLGEWRHDGSCWLLDPGLGTNRDRAATIEGACGRSHSR